VGESPFPAAQVAGHQNDLTPPQVPADIASQTQRFLGRLRLYGAAKFRHLHAFPVSLEHGVRVVIHVKTDNRPSKAQF